MFYGCGFPGSGWIFGGGFMMLLWVVAIGALIYFFVNKSDGKKISFKEKSAMDILDEKYINGEISKEEYEEKMGIIKKNRG